MRVPLVRRLATLAAAALLIALGGAVARADCPGTVATNGGFEGGFSDRGAAQVHVANGWTPFWQDGPNKIGDQSGFNVRPDYGAEDAVRYGRRRVREGNWAQKWSSQYATHHAGVWQQIDVAAGAKVTVRAWGQAWSSQGDQAETSRDGNYRLSVGIDPTGGTNWAAGSVIWSGANTLDQWVELTAQATATGAKVTVFLRGDCEYRNKHNDVYWDDVCATVEAPATATPKPQPTDTPEPTIPPTPTAIPTPEATATLEPSPTPQVGAIHALVFDDRNGNSLHDPSEPAVAGAVVRVLDAQRRTVAEETLDGQGPRAFAGLPPGNYTIIEENAEGYRSISPDLWAVSLAAGAVVEVMFADATMPPTIAPTVAPPTLAPTALPTALAPAVAPTTVPPTPAPTRAAPVVSLWGISGLLLAAVALGLVAGQLLLRRR